MRSIERRFLNLQEKQPSLSSFVNFERAIRGQRFSTDKVCRWFNKLVDKDDYDNRDKRAILKYLVSLTDLEGSVNQG